MDEKAVRDANVARAKAMLETFTPFEQSWIDGLHPDIAMEFRFGEAVGLPARVEGKAYCAGLFQTVVDKLGLAFSDIEILGMADPNLVLAQYKGKGAFGSTPYNQTYITLLEFRDGKLILYREYVDTQVVAAAFGHLSAIV